MDDRRGDAREQVNRSDHAQGDRFGVLDRERLRGQLADDDADEGEQGGDQDQREIRWLLLAMDPTPTFSSTPENLSTRLTAPTAEAKKPASVMPT